MSQAPPPGAPVVGVLALQGDVLEHLRALRRVGADAREVRTRPQLDEVDALVIPGGESTTIGRLLEVFDLLQPVRDRIRGGMPTLGTCAGMILLAGDLDQDRPQPLLGVLDVQVRRNAFGRQRESFDVQLPVPELGDEPVDVSFIRAPVVTDVRAADVEVLAAVELGPVLVRQGHVWAASFHPELTGDDRLHAAFVAAIPAGR
ncbi:pyridoxal 5'-phosphate synthase glutaminase subunit PdxT [Nitriliruptor alkaliphilus]|uniref:pyridoxal 5'-phosphate synthase glutaminase subunit PdxT n=1 Tax=Nitriliruptor alkaliphilus TaxID=427918 RepID=UPI000695C53E